MTSDEKMKGKTMYAMSEILKKVKNKLLGKKDRGGERKVGSIWKKGECDKRGGGMWGTMRGGNNEIIKCLFMTAILPEGGGSRV